MDPATDNDRAELKRVFEERLAQLPPAVQHALQKADVETRLRGLAGLHQLHIDQWELLENQVKLALYGFEDAANLQKNLQEVVGVDAATAETLGNDINDMIFEPVREELERELGNPEAKKEVVSDMETARQDILAEHATDLPTVLPVANTGIVKPSSILPATPPPPPPQGVVVRAPAPETYKPQEPSSVRPHVAGDPYREQVL